MRKKKKFYFIVFEGVEGTGKSFQIKKLYNKLKKKKFTLLRPENQEALLRRRKLDV